MAISIEKEEESYATVTGVVNIEQEMESTPVPISEAVVMKPLAPVLEDVVAKQITERLDLFLEAMVTDQETKPLTPVLGAKSISEEIESTAPVSEYVPSRVDNLAPIQESIPSEVAIPTQENLESLVAEPVPIVSEESTLLFFRRVRFLLLSICCPKRI